MQVESQNWALSFIKGQIYCHPFLLLMGKGFMWTFISAHVGWFFPFHCLYHECIFPISKAVKISH